MNIKDYKGNTPLHLCCFSGHLDPAIVLIGVQSTALPVAYCVRFLLSLSITVSLYRWISGLISKRNCGAASVGRGNECLVLSTELIR